MNREEALTEARIAAGKAESLARKAEASAENLDRKHLTPNLAAAGALWADVARAYADIAAATTDTEN
ncbi:hypothetical protein EJ357_22605 [Streptomyces cyaneochromogenes]|uniref:Uncharacterized protein n=1 Tax=Streptomyces cyaneochromogenes TaxID=2496836 RepID=A0A3Q9EUN8_9ACTN|nr:hypothetical protein [Streptomyces cyaneochromogenes]AZQ35925.1 hypothetical protein EJ357_22605 [Streptomyces cyaneochromogenes]